MTAVGASVAQRQGLAWSVALTGVVIGITGGVVAWWAQSDRAALDAQMVKGSSGYIESVSHQEAVDRTNSIANRWVAAGVLGGVGVATTATGAWLLWRAYNGQQTGASVYPTPDGLTIVGRF